jgi:formamidase
MSGLGGLNKSQNGVVIGMVQLQLPSVVTPADLARQTEVICAMVGKARRNLDTMDLVVFPEYGLHGLSMDTNPEIMCSIDGPEVAEFRKACIEHDIWGCFSIMEYNPKGNPYNTGLIIDDEGQLVLYYRKLHPWVPVEPWEPGDLGIPVCDGPNGCKLALIICHDGMFPEMARECAYKGAEVMLRTAGYTRPIRHAWKITNQANSFCNLMVTANVCMAGTDGSFNSMGEGMIVNFDGVPLAEGNGAPDEIITAEVRPDLVREARTGWGVENNIYQLGHRAYVAVQGGAQDCPYTFNARPGERRVPVALGRPGRGDRRHELWLCPAGTGVRRQHSGRVAAGRQSEVNASTRTRRGLRQRHWMFPQNSARTSQYAMPFRSATPARIVHALPSRALPSSSNVIPSQLADTRTRL